MYLDPGFGGMLIQIIVAIVAAGGATMFALRKKIRAAFSNKNGSDSIKQPLNTNEDSEDEVIDMLSDEK